MYVCKINVVIILVVFRVPLREQTKLERSSAIALHVLETEQNVDFDNPEVLSKYWPIYRDRINAEQRQSQPSSVEFNLS